MYIYTGAMAMLGLCSFVSNFVFYMTLFFPVGMSL